MTLTPCVLVFILVACIHFKGSTHIRMPVWPLVCLWGVLCTRVHDTFCPWQRARVLQGQCRLVQSGGCSCVGVMEVATQ